MNPIPGATTGGGVTVDPTVRPLSFQDVLDLDARAQTDDVGFFGEKASYQPKEAGALAFYVTGVFEDTPTSPDVFGEVGAQKVTFQAPTLDLLRAVRGDLIVIRDDTWSVAKVDHDNGMTTLTLSKNGSP